MELRLRSDDDTGDRTVLDAVAVDKGLEGVLDRVVGSDWVPVLGLLVQAGLRQQGVNIRIGA